MKKRILAATLLCTMALGGTAAYAQTKSVGGGTWTYGVNSSVYSEYEHNSKEHGSSVRNGNNQMDTDYNEPAGSTASASISATSSGNQSYYCTGHR